MFFLTKILVLIFCFRRGIDFSGTGRTKVRVSRNTFRVSWLQLEGALRPQIHVGGRKTVLHRFCFRSVLTKYSLHEGDAEFELRFELCRLILTTLEILLFLIHKKLSYFYAPNINTDAAQRRCAWRRDDGASRRAPTGGAYVERGGGRQTGLKVQHTNTHRMTL